jgi:hypothetical protein
MSHPIVLTLLLALLVLSGLLLRSSYGQLFAITVAGA